MLSILIFSKNRACQTDLLLRSIKEKLHIKYNLYCIYKSDNPLSRENYYKVFNMHPVHCIPEVNFESDVKELLRLQIGTEYLLCLTDDDVFINDIQQDEYDMLLKQYDNTIHALSLRMNPEVNFCYPAEAHNQNMVIPQFIEKEKYLKWNWQQYNPASDYGYPACINAHIYRTDFLKQWIKDLHFSYPNPMEGEMNHHRDNTKPYMIGFKESKVLNVMNNFVKSGCDIVNFGMSVQKLDNIFMSGQRISTKNIYGLKLKQVHIPIEYQFESY